MSTTHLNHDHDNPLDIRLGKICRLCNLSCEGRPRVKDSRGRYYCQSCYQEQRRRRAERQRRESRATSEATSLDARPMSVNADAFADLHVESKRRCDGCRAFIGASDVVCIHCGFNRDTGQHLDTLVASDSSSNERAESEDSEPAWYAPRSLLSNGWIVYAGIQVPFLVMFFNAYADGPRAVAGLWPILLGFDAFVWLGVLVAAAMSSVGWALACMFVPFVSLWWVYMESESGLLKILVTVSLVNEAIRACMWL